MPDYSNVEAFGGRRALVELLAGNRASDVDQAAIRAWLAAGGTLAQLADLLGSGVTPMFPDWAFSPTARNYTGSTGSVGAANRGHWSLMVVKRKLVMPTAKMGAVVANQAGNWDLGIYRADGTGGLPKTRVASSGSTAVPAASNNGAAVTVGTNVSLTPGIYWLALSSDSNTPTWRCVDDPLGSAAAFTVNPRQLADTAFPLPADASGLAFSPVVASTATPGIWLVGIA